MGDQVKETKETGKSVDTLNNELERIKKEEQRYIKAYGEEMIDSGQLKEATDELKLKKVSLEKQIGAIQKDTVVSNFSLPKDREIDEFCKIVYKILGGLGFEAKQAIVRKVVDTIVSMQVDIRVYGHLPINTSIIANIWKGDVQEVEYGTKCRDWEDQKLQFAPFSFKLYLPPLRKARIIIARNKWGQIEKARSPYVKTHHLKL